jgi:hypothetical protein
MLGAGIATMLVGLPFTIFAAKNLTKSIELYNGQYASAWPSSIHLDIGATSHGIGFCLNF